MFLDGSRNIDESRLPSRLIRLSLAFLLVTSFARIAPCQLQFLYVANASANNISGYVVNPQTGVLTQIPGSPFPAGTSPAWVTVHPNNHFLYAVNSADDTISAYSIDQTSGALTPLAGSPFYAGITNSGNYLFATSLVIDPTGRFAWVGSVQGSATAELSIAGDGSLSLFQIEAGGGGEPAFAAVDGTGTRVYFSNIRSNDIGGYSVSTTNGVMTLITGSPFAAPGDTPAQLAIDPSNRFLYAAEAHANEVSEFTINQSTGALASFATIPAGAGPNGIAMHPSGKFLYVANCTGGSISTYTINSTTGALSSMSNSPVALAVNTCPDGLAVDPTGQWLAVAKETSSDVSVFQVDATSGSLTQVPGSPFASGAGANSVAFASVQAQSSVIPNYGGNSGQVTIQVIDTYIQPGASAKLTGVGGDIAGLNTYSSTTGSLGVTFNLTNAVLGGRNVVINNPDGTVVTLPTAFTVQQGGASNLNASIIGFDKIRIGVPQTFYLSYGNSGTIDALGVRLIAYVPSSVAPNLTLGNSNGVVTTATQGTTTLIMINLGRVPAGSTSFIPVTLTAGASQAPFQIQINISGH